MKKKDILQSNISCEFSNLCESLLSELNQSTINSALNKYDLYKHKNPVAKANSVRFTKLAQKQGTRRGIFIRTALSADEAAEQVKRDKQKELLPHDTGMDYLHKSFNKKYINFYIESGSIAKDDPNTIRLKAFRELDRPDPDRDRVRTGGGDGLMYLEYQTESNTLYRGSSRNARPEDKLYLREKIDAQNLAKAIKQYTGVTVSWKSMDFS